MTRQEKIMGIIYLSWWNNFFQFFDLDGFHVLL